MLSARWAPSPGPVRSPRRLLSLLSRVFRVFRLLTSPSTLPLPHLFPLSNAIARTVLMTDMCLTTDKSFRKYVDVYAADNDTFLKDFAKDFGQLLELGVPRS